MERQFRIRYALRHRVLVYTRRVAKHDDETVRRILCLGHRGIRTSARLSKRRAANGRRFARARARFPRIDTGPRDYRKREHGARRGREYLLRYKSF